MLHLKWDYAVNVLSYPLVEYSSEKFCYVQYDYQQHGI